MISKENLEFVAKLMDSDDKEIQKLAQTIFMECNPSGEDVENLYYVRNGNWKKDAETNYTIQTVLTSEDYIL